MIPILSKGTKLKQSLSPSKQLAACLQEVSNGFPFPAKEKASAFMSFVGDLGDVHFHASTKPKRNVSSVSSVNCHVYIITICPFQSQLDRASNLPAWVIDSLTT